MLKTRVITALILIPLLVISVLYAPTHWLAFGFGLFILIGAWEWSALSGFTSFISRIAYLGLACFLMWHTYGWLHSPIYIDYLLYVVLVWWLIAFLWLSITPAKLLLANAVNVYLRGVIGMLLLIPAWLSLLVLHNEAEQGQYLLLGLFILIWVADSGAYFSGKYFGRLKLAPDISPGKTMEGVYGALFISLIYAVILSLLLGYSFTQVIAFTSVALLCVIFSILGDLFESVAKRVAGVKDSGTIFPGHGGVMDRIDSLTAAAPLFLLGMNWFPGLM